jgi:hypothetical protein
MLAVSEEGHLLPYAVTMICNEQFAASQLGGVNRFFVTLETIDALRMCGCVGKASLRVRVYKRRDTKPNRESS